MFNVVGSQTGAVVATRALGAVPVDPPSLADCERSAEPAGTVAARKPPSGNRATPSDRAAKAPGAASAIPSNAAKPTIRTRTAGMKPDQKTDRRTFLKRSAITGGLLAGAGVAIAGCGASSDGTQTQPSGAPLAQPARRVAPTTAAARRPNILVIMVDQLRYPQWFGPIPGGGVNLPPNLQRLRRGAVSFGRHYTVSNDCTPSRAAMLTGLYTHQTGCMITGGSTLDPGFPTWGTMLREHGYQTRWYGKWHLTHHDNKWTQAKGRPLLEDYGFAGGTYPSPDGGPGQGWRVDPQIARQFDDWFNHEGGGEPWCTTVSFVNPARHRLVVQVERPRPSRGAGTGRDRAPAAQLRDAGAADRAQQAAACNAPSRTQRLLRSDRSRSAAPKRAADGWNSSIST